MSVLTPEVEPRTERAKLAPLDYESRAVDLAIASLEDVDECDEAHVCVKWATLAGKNVPLLYVYFAGCVGDQAMPRVHVDELGDVRPSHAVCLARMPSGALLEGSQVKEIVRRGVDEFLRKYNVRKASGVKMTLGQQ